MQKQLLIQKLYDTYKATEARKRNMTFLKRVRRAAGELVGRSRSRDPIRTLSPSDSAADSSSVESHWRTDSSLASPTRFVAFNLPVSYKDFDDPLTNLFSYFSLAFLQQSQRTKCHEPLFRFMRNKG